PFRMTKNLYGLCKPAIVLGVWDEFHNLLSLHVIGTLGGPAELIDQCYTGHGDGQWHYISDCPYSFTFREPDKMVATATSNGTAVFPALATQVITRALA